MLRLLVSVCIFSLFISDTVKNNSLLSTKSSKIDYCPVLEIETNNKTVKEGEDIFFRAQINDKTYKISSYKWSISDGFILDGQGTSSLTVHARGIKNGEIDVKVEVTGLPTKCTSSATLKVTIEAMQEEAEAELLAEFDPFTIKKEIKKVDNLITKASAILEQEPLNTFYITMLSGRRQKEYVKGQTEWLVKTVSKKIDPSRVTFVDFSNFETKNTKIQFWSVPPGATPPLP